MSRPELKQYDRFADVIFGAYLCQETGQIARLRLFHALDQSASIIYFSSYIKLENLHRWMRPACSVVCGGRGGAPAATIIHVARPAAVVL